MIAESIQEEKKTEVAGCTHHCHCGHQKKQEDLNKLNPMKVPVINEQIKGSGHQTSLFG
jgi:hypothetical protein